VQHLGSHLNDNNGISGNGFKFTLPNPVLAGNALILGISYVYSPSRTVMIADTSGDTWPAPAITTTDSANLAQQIYVLPSARAGTHTITITFDAPLQPFQYSISEFRNIATSAPVDGTQGMPSVLAPNVSAGSFTPATNNDLNGGHLIWNYCISQDKIGTLAVNRASNIAPTGGALLLDANNSSTIPSTTSYYIQTARAAINPGFTITQQSSTNFACSAVALKVATAGTAPGSGIRVVRILHTTWGEATTGDWVLHFPSEGNLLFAATTNGSDVTNIDSASDSNGQSYSKVGDPGNPQVFYKSNASSGNALKITFHIQSAPVTNLSMRFFDIVGADPNAFDTTAGIYTAAPTSGTIVPNVPTFTPAAAPGLTIVTMGLGAGPSTGLAPGAPASAVFDLVYYAGETDQDRMDNADGVAHVYHSSTATQSWNWSITDASHGSTAFATAVSFKSAPVSPVTNIVAAVLPYARSVRIGTQASAFGSVINAGSNVATSCSLVPPGPQGSFIYQTTTASNQLTGSPNTPIDIPTGGTQHYVFGYTPSVPLNSLEIGIVFQCTNTAPAPTVDGVNTFIVSASNTPTPDIVAIGATSNSDGIVHIPGMFGTSFFAAAGVNLGVASTITVAPDDGGHGLPVTLTVCPTDPNSGSCLAPPASSTTVSYGSNQTLTFTVFVQGIGNVPFDPANNRLFLRFKDAGSVTRGATNVAVKTD
jgi:hypothetical protein